MAFNFPSNKRPSAYERGIEEGRDGMPLQFVPGPAGELYRAGWYRGYHDQLTREVRAYNVRHGTNYEPRGPY